MYSRKENGRAVIGGNTRDVSYRISMVRSYSGELFGSDGKLVATADIELGRDTTADKPNPRKPGDLMAVVARDVFGFGFDANCSCKKIQREMNAHGWGWCIRNRKDLMKRISDSAIKRNPPIAIDPDSIWQALKDAWKQRGGVAKE